MGERNMLIALPGRYDDSPGTSSRNGQRVVLNDGFEHLQDGFSGLLFTAGIDEKDLACLIGFATWSFLRILFFITGLYVFVVG